MILKCQRDSYLKEFSGVVDSCKEFDESPADQKQYLVTLNDTILFPEGGGQPCDHGKINSVSVLKVTKVNGLAVHLTDGPLDTGTQVDIKLDWRRRFDHMQQHSGQHLLSALAETMFKYNTTSWNLGDDISFVELDTLKVTREEMDILEEEINHKIRQALPLLVEYYSSKEEALQKASKRLELPETSHEEIRVVTIEGIDVNTCCGTHVAHTGHLQVLKLVSAEKGKKNKTNLYFLVGNRVLGTLSGLLERERQMTTLVKCCPSDHLEMIAKIQKSLKVAQKKSLSSFRELAVLEARQLKTSNKDSLLSYHRPDGDAEFLSFFSNEFKDSSMVLFLTAGELKGSGFVLILGPQSVLEAAGPKICDILEGKGNSKNGRFQAKVNRLNRREEALEILKEHVNSK